MNHKKLLLSGFVSTLLVVIYTLAVSWFTNNAERWFGAVDNKLLAPAAFLMLFVISAAIVGMLIMGRPTMMYLSGEKKQGITLFCYTIGWMVIGLGIIILILL